MQSSRCSSSQARAQNSYALQNAQQFEFFADFAATDLRAAVSQRRLTRRPLTAMTRPFGGTGVSTILASTEWSYGVPQKQSCVGEDSCLSQNGYGNDSFCVDHFENNISCCLMVLCCSLYFSNTYCTSDDHKPPQFVDLRLMPSCEPLLVRTKCQSLLCC